tara:strand:- start:1838 stop:1948 length:111 start_codon:yes stop_codon:yes gene_type:complete
LKLINLYIQSLSEETALRRFGEELDDDLLFCFFFEV